MHDIIDRLYTMLIIEVHYRPNIGATSRRDNRVYLRRRVITFLEQFLRTFGGFSTQKALASGAEPQAPLGELTALPQTPWLGGRGAPLPHPPRGGSASSFAPPPATPSPVPPPVPISWIRPSPGMMSQSCQR